MKSFQNKAKAFVRPLYLLLIRARQSLRWHYQFTRAKREGFMPDHLQLLEINKDERIAILAPHADDEWIGVFSVLNQHFPNISCVYFNLYGDDPSEHNVKTRNREIIASSDYWGFNLINNYNYNNDSLKMVLREATVCFIPTPYDWHDEHRSVFQAFVNCYLQMTDDEKNRLAVYYYYVSVPHSNKECQYYIPLTYKDLSKKWELFAKVYSSQSFMPSERYKYQLRLIPSEVGYAAQSFIRTDQTRLVKDLEKTYDEHFVDIIKSLKYIINNIYEIRNYMDSIIYE